MRVYFGTEWFTVFCSRLLYKSFMDVEDLLIYPASNRYLYQNITLHLLFQTLKIDCDCFHADIPTRCSGITRTQTHLLQEWNRVVGVWGTWFPVILFEVSARRDSSRGFPGVLTSVCEELCVLDGAWLLIAENNVLSSSQENIIGFCQFVFSSRL